MVVFVVGVAVVSVTEVVVAMIKLTGGLVILYIVAVILVFPTANPVAKPPEPAKDIIATFILELDHIA